MSHLLIIFGLILVPVSLILWLAGGKLVGPCAEAEKRYRLRLRAARRLRYVSRTQLGKLLADGLFGNEPDETDEDGVEPQNQSSDRNAAREEQTIDSPRTGWWRRGCNGATAVARMAGRLALRSGRALSPPPLAEKTFACALGRFLSALLIAVSGTSAAAAEGALFLATFPEYLPENAPEWMERPGVLIAAATLASCITWGGILLEAVGVVRVRVFRGRGMALLAVAMIGLALVIALDAAHVRGLVEAINAKTVDMNAGLHQLAELKLGLFMELSILVFVTAPIGVAAALESVVMAGSLCVFAIRFVVEEVLLLTRRAGATVLYTPACMVGIVVRWLGGWEAHGETRELPDRNRRAASGDGQEESSPDTEDGSATDDLVLIA